ncbi:MAG: (E)-4-hydroxy-3-methylbut-2-enyl-diphosphate synthase [Thermosediminibacterales bacterium]|jgi:(E)-4-hydroxy-3-methylbut-2-enyl-diphosphate synthase|nr:(E)-4-hydroxy-3-methylbut-2-enyl-diphosphate synthase [Thermosediminibacterales bacterium]
MRRKTRQIMLGKVPIGGHAPISVQTMTNTKTSDVQRTIDQIRDVQQFGCDIIRVAVPDEQAAGAISHIKKAVSIPLVADIHFNYELALKAIDAGADGLRINPGNIGNIDKVEKVVKKAKNHKIPIRIGVNAGSLEKDILEKYKFPTAEGMVESALRHIRILEKLDFKEIKISLKSSDVMTTIRAYKLLADKVDYPFHLGITEAGTLWSGTIKSAVGLGSLLAQGIGDTIRVSLTGDPREEVKVGLEILKVLGLRKRGVEIISCPTCGRCKIDLIKIANEIQDKTSLINYPIKIAVMGCVVNGPGEAKEADLGVTGGNGVGIIFKKGKVIKKVPEGLIVDELLKEIKNLDETLNLDKNSHDF